MEVELKARNQNFIKEFDIKDFDKALATNSPTALLSENKIIFSDKGEKESYKEDKISSRSETKRLEISSKKID